MIISDATISSQDKERILSEINRLRSALSIDVPFTMPLIKFRVKFVNLISAYMATNGFELFVDPKKWDKMSNKHKLFAFLHEWHHVVNLHAKRLGNRNMRMFNFAADFSINLHITNDINSSSSMEMADGMLYDKSYNGWFTEQIYDDLKKRVEEIKSNIETETYSHDGYVLVKMKRKDKPNQGDAPQEPSKYCDKERAAEILAFDQYLETAMGDDLLPPPVDADSKEKELIKDIIKAAEMHKKMRGTLPGDYEEAIKRLRKSQVPWQNILHSFYKEVISSLVDRTFRRPKKWCWEYGIILPSEVGAAKADVVLIVDTSGSMSVDSFEQVAGEMKKLLPLTSKLTVISADTTVHEKMNINNIHEIIGDKAKFRFKGRGGTCFVEALELAAKLKADMVIYYTDGYGNFGKGKPKGINNLLWILTSDNSQKPPYGKYITINN